MYPPQTSVRPTVAALGAGLLALGSAVSMADCDARSGTRTAALVELYTSEGCSSCPPAEQQLGRLAQVLDAGADAVPLALHVGYWDELGWKDAYAQTAFGERQQWLVAANRQNTVYTPQFFVAGSAVRDWPDGLRDQVQEINARPATARIRVQAKAQDDAVLSLQIEAATVAGASSAALYLALAESGLVATVARGENGGRTLAHEHVVRAWIGPLAVTDDGLSLRRALPLAADWNRARLEVIAFIQDTNNGRVLQALGAQQCAAS